MEFQSTHSLRSATAGRSRRSPGGCGFNPRTPCGVRLLSKIPLGGYGRFNPRTPRGVRPLRAVFAGRFRRFQSTHSLRSATPVVADLAAFEVVSIHALLAECDKGGSHEPGSTGSFNPRTPCGVRLLVDVIRISNAEVSIHALLAECDFWLTLSGLAMLRFQSTHSLRSATPSGTLELYGFIVSIHALLAECDGWLTEEALAATKFQSTHSLRSATRMRGSMQGGNGVSIHALLAECDQFHGP